MNRKHSKMTYILVSLLLLVGCASSGNTPQLLSYLALERPKGRIDHAPHPPIRRSFHRGGFYVFNVNFRPAADVGKYLAEVEREAGRSLLRQADVRLRTPFAIKFWVAGYNEGEDTVVAGARP